MLYGYAGKILHVDLTTHQIAVEEPSEEFYRTYVGGSALGLYYLFKHTPAGADPLGPENTLTLALSGVTGAAIAGQSRCTAVAKSPLTGGAGDSQAGGFWPAELKFAGFDAVVIRGASPEPVYLWIHQGEAELRLAAHLWGKRTRQVDRMLQEELDDTRVQIAQIGPAGEKQVRFAAIMNMANRAHGRTGMGAVMGSKNLKAIVVRGGKKKLDLADPEGLRAIMQASLVGVREDEDIVGLAQYGTIDILESQSAVGGLPTRNWTSGAMPEARAAAISGPRLFDEFLRGAAEGTQMKTGRDTCFSCAIRCKRVVESEWEGRPIDPASGGPEYETTSVFGSYCDIDDLGAVSYANQLCNEYGVDTIAAGATMAFAIECFERGVITAKDTGGIELAWGDAPAMIRMLEATLEREGFGDVLAEGSARAAASIGNGAGAYAMTVKGTELPAHMPHVKRSLALVYAVNPFGADHQSSEHDPGYEPETIETSPDKYGRRMASLGLTEPQDPMVLNRQKVEFALRTQYAYSAMDTVNVCQFVYGPAWELMGMEELAGVVTAVTGVQTTVDGLQEIGARRLNMLRAFNAREGLTRESDTLPRRLFDEPLQGGMSDGVSIDEAELAAALDEYHRMAGWDLDTGSPTRETLEGLGLAWIADEIGV
ncbi:MAG: aldehyde ferredoxin oxidoreductase family protein [Actinobacteria bacterium]|nr:aldehyde ferredoxin oxidoreductase family protein [Actinomycetota bacterium]